MVVMTNEPQRYEPFCEQVYETLGAPVLISPSDSSLSGCAIVAAPEGIPRELCTRGFPPVISALPAPAKPNFPLMSLFKLDLENELIKLVPKGIDPVLFFGALYEKYRVNSLEETAASAGRVDGISIPIEQYAKFIKA